MIFFRKKRPVEFLCKQARELKGTELRRFFDSLKTSEMTQLVKELSPDYIDGLSLLGGEPFEPANQAALLPFLRRVRERYPQKNIWCYTGYLFDRELLSDSRARCEQTDEMLSLLDVSTGVCRLQSGFPLTMTAFAVGFGELCVHFQIFAALR